MYAGAVDEPLLRRPCGGSAETLRRRIFRPTKVSPTIWKFRCGRIGLDRLKRRHGMTAPRGETTKPPPRPADPLTEGATHWTTNIVSSPMVWRMSRGICMNERAGRQLSGPLACMQRRYSRYQTQKALFTASRVARNFGRSFVVWRADLGSSFQNELVGRNFLCVAHTFFILLSQFMSRKKNVPSRDVIELRIRALSGVAIGSRCYRIGN